MSPRCSRGPLSAVRGLRRAAGDEGPCLLPGPSASVRGVDGPVTRQPDRGLGGPPEARPTDVPPTEAQLAGLTTHEAFLLAQTEGPNSLPRPRRTPAWQMLLAQMTHFFALMLWVAAGMALLAGMPALGLAIALIVFLNGTFAFIQEHRADRAAEKLGDLMPASARVRRDGQPHTVHVTELVRGDVVLLSAGDRVPADLLVGRGEELGVDESMLTGESVPATVGAGQHLFAGTFVAQGDAEGLVEATGSHTRLADMAALTEGATRPASPLSIQLNRLVRLIAAIALGVGVVLAGVGIALGSSVTTALLFGVGVTVALVPEGLLPTVTLSLARGAQRMASQHALVRRLEAVETLGATTFICTDKTGTITRNQMSVVEVWTPAGTVVPRGAGYEPVGIVTGDPAAVRLALAGATAARACVLGRAVPRNGEWVPEGDPMEVALDTLASRLGAMDVPPTARLPFSNERLFSAAVVDGRLHVLGAPETVLAVCSHDLGPEQATAVLNEYADQGRRVLATARAAPGVPALTQEDLRHALDFPLELLSLVAIEDPPRDGVREALHSCRTAGIRVAMMTGDNARTAAAIARQVGLLGPGGVVVEGAALPADDAALADLLDSAQGAVVARVSPADKLRIAGALRQHGHVVAMTGDGVNDAAALRGADVGVAMGKSGSDVARQSADLVLLDDHFATIVRAIELGRATYANVRRFLTFHLTDNVAELTPFAVWALSGGAIPAAIGVLQVLALDIGTDMLPALALGAEPASRRTMDGPRRQDNVADGRVLRRALLVLGLLEASMSMAAFLWVLHGGGWSVGETPDATLLASASGTTFAVIAVAQIANAFACRSETHPAWRLNPLRNPLVLVAVGTELVLLVTFLGVPWVSDLLGGDWPPLGGWVWAACAGLLLIAVDAGHKGIRARRRA